AHPQRIVRSPREGLSVVHAKNPTVAYYRFLYDAVGRDDDWTSRKKLSDACTVAYCTLDATGTRQQGPGGAKAEGRMAYVGGIYTPPPPDWLRPLGQGPPAVQARYVAGLDELHQMGPLLRRQAARVGMERAEVWVALTDGGNGLEGVLQTNFNRADLVVILD